MIRQLSRMAFDVVFPKADDCPSFISQRRGNPFVSCSVFSNLGFPKGRIRFRTHTVIRAAMPEASVTKHGHSGSWKGDIRPSSYLVTQPIAEPG